MDYTKSVIMQSKEYFGGTSMTAVIAMRNENGMVFCSDSRSVKICYGGVPIKQDKPIRKVFSNDLILIAQHGNNTYYKEYQESYIEGIIDEILAVKEVNSPNMFCNAFQSRLRLYCPPDFDTDYHFLFGLKDNGRYRIYSLQGIRKVNNDYRINEMYGEYVFAGTIDLIPPKVSLPPNASIDTMKTIGRKIIEFSESLGNILVGDENNPVGGEIQFASIT